MIITLDTRPHPITDDGREIVALPHRPGITLADVTGPGDWMAAVDGEYIAADEWGSCVLRPGAIVSRRAAVAGDIVRGAAQLAIIAAATWVAGPAGAAALGVSAEAAALLGAGLLVGGNLILNALFPLEIPAIDPGVAAEPEPVYSIAGARNRRRPHAPLPLVLGRHRIVPDLAVAPLTEFQGGEQYFAAVYHFGVGNIEVTDIELNGTPIADLSDTVHQWGDARGRTTVAGRNVDTHAGAALESATEAFTVTVDDPVSVAVDLVARVFSIGAGGGYEAATAAAVIEVSAVGATRAVTATEVFSSSTPDPIRRTVSLTIPTTGALPPEGRWTVKVRRQAAPSGETTTTDDIQATAIKVTHADDVDYSGQARLAVRARATNQLSGQITLTALAELKVPTWNGTAWTPPAKTTNPAWIFRAFALGWSVAGRLVAGAGLPASRIDDAGLKEWGAWCATQQLGCSMVVDRPMNVGEVLAAIARCGRAAVTWQTGRLGVVWEDAARLPSALVTPGNIVAGTFMVEYASRTLPDEIVVSWIDPDADWQRATVRRQSGAGVPARSRRIDLLGVTSARQAAIFANLALASQKYHRRRYTWEAGPEALASLRRGDVVWLTHSLIDGGKVGRVEAVDGVRLTLSDTVSISDETDHIVLSAPNGRLHSTTVSHPGGPAARGETNVVVLAAAIPAPPPSEPAYEPSDILWRYYSGTAEPSKVRLVATEPRVGGSVRITAIDEDRRYHDAATADLTTDTTSAHPNLPVVVSIYAWTDTYATASGSVARVSIEIVVSGQWTGGEVSVAGADVGPVGRIPADGSTLRWSSPRTGTISIKVVPDGHPAGAKTVTYTIDGPALLPVPWRYRGPWLTATAYELNDVVTAGGASYICELAHTSAAASKPTTGATWDTYWDPLAERGLPGVGGLNGEDGRGVEHIYCTTSAAVTQIAESQRPVDTWAFDAMAAPGGLANTLRNGLQWYDGSPPNFGVARPITWWSTRGVPGTPAIGDAPPASGPWPRDDWTRWSIPRILSRYAVDGQDGRKGDDGAGWEQVYACGERRFTHIAESQRPVDTWAFDDSRLKQATGIVVNGLSWHDGDPPGYNATRPRLWWSRRAVPGTPTGRSPPASGPWPRDGWGQWTEPANIQTLPENQITDGSHYVIAGDVMVAWGHSDVGLRHNGHRIVSFPIAFGGAPGVVVTARSANPDGIYFGTDQITTTTFRVSLDLHSSGSPPSGSSGYNWIAVGPAA